MIHKVTFNFCTDFSLVQLHFPFYRVSLCLAASAIAFFVVYLAATAQAGAEAVAHAPFWQFAFAHYSSFTLQRNLRNFICSYVAILLGNNFQSHRHRRRRRRCCRCRRRCQLSALLWTEIFAKRFTLDA